MLFIPCSMFSQYTATFVDPISVAYEFNLTCIITFSILFKGLVCLSMKFLFIFFSTGLLASKNA